MPRILWIWVLVPGIAWAEGAAVDPCPETETHQGEIPLERVTIRYCETGDLVRLVIDDHDRQSVTVIDIPPVKPQAE